ncbi:MAG: hypothetical protein AB1324_05580 [Candidatus Micrarchaeota archaeon]
MRNKAVGVTRDGDTLRGDSGMGKTLGVRVSELGAARIFEHMMGMGEGEWTSLWTRVRDGLIREEAAQADSVFNPRPGEAPQDAGAFLGARVPLNVNDPANQRFLPPDYGGPTKQKAPVPPAKPPQAKVGTGTAQLGTTPVGPPPLPFQRAGPGGTKIMGGGQQRAKPPPLPKQKQQSKEAGTGTQPITTGDIVIEQPRKGPPPLPQNAPGGGTQQMQAPKPQPAPSDSLSIPIIVEPEPVSGPSPKKQAAAPKQEQQVDVLAMQREGADAARKAFKAPEGADAAALRQLARARREEAETLKKLPDVPGAAKVMADKHRKIGALEAEALLLEERATALGGTQPPEPPLQLPKDVSELRSVVEELAKLSPPERVKKIQEMSQKDSSLATTIAFMIRMPKEVRERILADWTRAQDEIARVKRVNGARAAMKPDDIKAQEHALILGTPEDWKAGRMPPAIEEMAKARGLDPKGLQRDLGADYAVGGRDEVLERLIGMDNIRLASEQTSPTLHEQQSREVFDLVIRGNLEGRLREQPGLEGSKITGIEYLSGMSGIYNIEVTLPSGAKRRVLVKMEEQAPAKLGVDLARHHGLVAPEVRPGFQFDTGVVDPQNKQPVMQAFGILQHVSDLAAGKPANITLADGRSVAASEGTLVSARMPDSKKVEQVRVVSVGLLNEILVNPSAYINDPVAGAAAQEIFRLMGTAEGRQAIGEAWNAYHEMSRRALLMDRFARNTAVMLVDRGAQLPPSERYKVVFGPIDTDGVSSRIGAHMDSGKPALQRFNADFAEATADFVVKLSRAADKAAGLEAVSPGGERRKLYDAGPLGQQAIYGDFLSDRARGGLAIPPEFPPARKKAVDEIIVPNHGKPVGLGFDTSRADKPNVGSPIEIGGRPRVIERSDGRVLLDAGEMRAVYEAAAQGQKEFADSMAQRIVDLATQAPMMRGRNDFEKEIIKKLNSNPEFQNATAARKLELAKAELEKVKAPSVRPKQESYVRVVGPEQQPSPSKKVLGMEPTESDVVRARKIEENKRAQEFTDPDKLMEVAVGYAKGEKAAMDAVAALGDHPAAGIIRGLAERRAFKTAATKNDTVALKRFREHDAATLAGRIGAEGARIAAELAPPPVQKPAAATGVWNPRTRRWERAETAPTRETVLADFDSIAAGKKEFAGSRTAVSEAEEAVKLAINSPEGKKAGGDAQAYAEMLMGKMSRELAKIKGLPEGEREAALHRLMRGVEYLVARAIENPANTAAWVRFIDACPDISSFALIARRGILPGAKDITIQPVTLTAQDAKAVEAVVAAARGARGKPDSKAEQLRAVVDSIPDAWLAEAGLDRKQLRSKISMERDELRAVNALLEKHGLAIMSMGQKDIVLYKVTHVVSSNRWESTHGVLVVPVEGEANPLLNTYAEFHQSTDQIFVLHNPEHVPDHVAVLKGAGLNDRQIVEVAYVHEFQHYLDRLSGILRDLTISGNQEKTAVARESIGMLTNGVAPAQLLKMLSERAKVRAGTPHATAYEDISGHLSRELGENWASRPKEDITAALSSYIDKEYKKMTGLSFTDLVGTRESVPTLAGELDKLRGGTGKVAPGEEATKVGTPMPPAAEQKAAPAEKPAEKPAGGAIIGGRLNRAEENDVAWSLDFNRKLNLAADGMKIDSDVLFDAFIRYARGKGLVGTFDRLNDFLRFARGEKPKTDVERAKANNVKIAIREAKKAAEPPKEAVTPLMSMTDAEAQAKLEGIMKDWGASTAQELFESLPPTQLREEMQNAKLSSDRINRFMDTYARNTMRYFETEVKGKADAGLLDAIREGGEAGARKWLREQGYPDRAAGEIPRLHYREQLIEREYVNSREYQMFAGLPDNVRSRIFISEDAVKALKADEEVAMRFVKTIPEVEAAIRTSTSSKLEGTSSTFEGGNLYNIDLGGKRGLFAREGDTGTVIFVGDHSSYETKLNSYKKKGSWVKHERTAEISLDGVLEATRKSIEKKYSTP